MRERRELQYAVAQGFGPTSEGAGARVESQREGSHCCEAGWVLPQQGSKAMEEGDEVSRLGRVWRIEGWREDCWNYQTMDRGRWRFGDGGLEGVQDWLERRG